MKKEIFTIGLLAMLLFFNPLTAQDDSLNVESTEQAMDSANSQPIEETQAQDENLESMEEEEEVEELEVESKEDNTSVSQALKLKFIEGGPLFMSFVLIALILGLALSI